MRLWRSWVLFGGIALLAATFLIVKIIAAISGVRFDLSNASVSLAALVAGVVASGLSLRLERRRRRTHSLTEPTMEERANRLAQLLRDSTALIEELTAEMNARAATVERLKSEAEHAERLAELHREEQDAVTRLLRAELDRQGRRSFWQGAAVNVLSGALFFIAGIFATLWLS